MNFAILLLILVFLALSFTNIFIAFPVYLLGLLQSALGYLLLGVLVLFLIWCFGG